MKHYYPVIFFPEENSFSAVIPDLDGCFSQGKDLTRAMYWVQDAIGTYLYDVNEEKFPSPSKVSDIDTSEYPNAIVNIIEFDFEEWKSSLNNPIRHALYNSGMPARQLAKIMGAPYRTIKNYDEGKVKPPEWIEKLIVEKIINSI